MRSSYAEGARVGKREVCCGLKIEFKGGKKDEIHVEYRDLDAKMKETIHLAYREKRRQLPLGSSVEGSRLCMIYLHAGVSNQNVDQFGNRTGYLWKNSSSSVI